MNYSPGGYYQPPENRPQPGYDPGFNNGPWYSGLKMSHFIHFDVWMREKNLIRKLSILAAGAVLLYIVFSGVFVGAFQGILTLISMLTNGATPSFTTLWKSAEFMYLFEVLYSVFIVGGPFFLLGYIFNKKIIPVNIPVGKPRNAKYLPLVVLGGFGVCLAGNIITSYIDIFFETITGMGLEMPEMAETPRNAGGVLLYYLSTAVVPALIEEMALRGVVMQPLRRYGDWYAIICSAIIFGLMHCNLLQIPFAFIAGIAIGYAVIVTESVWTGIIIHFCNNAFAVTMSIVYDFCGADSVQYMITNIFFYAVIVIGLACAFIYVKKLDKTEFKKSPLVNSGKGFAGLVPMYSAKITKGTLFKTYLATAPMVIALIAVIYETVAAMLIL